MRWRLSVQSQKLHTRKANPISPFRNRVVTGDKNWMWTSFFLKAPTSRHPWPVGQGRKTSKMKNWSTASARLSTYAPWLQTHRQNPRTGNNHPLLQIGDRHTHKRTDGWTDRRYQAHYLPPFAVDNEGGLFPLLPLRNVESLILFLLDSVTVPVRSTPLYQITPSLVSPDMNDAYHAVWLPLLGLWNSESMCMREGTINN